MNIKFIELHCFISFNDSNLRNLVSCFVGPSAQGVRPIVALSARLPSLLRRPAGFFTVWNVPFYRPSVIMSFIWL